MPSSTAVFETIAAAAPASSTMAAPAVTSAVLETMAPEEPAPPPTEELAAPPTPQPHPTVATWNNDDLAIRFHGFLLHQLMLGLPKLMAMCAFLDSTITAVLGFGVHRLHALGSHCYEASLPSSALDVCIDLPKDTPVSGKVLLGRMVAMLAGDSKPAGVTGIKDMMAAKGTIGFRYYGASCDLMSCTHWLPGRCTRPH